MDAAPTTKPAIEQIAERITDAIMEHRLPPGVKLGEDRLAQTFNVSRTKVRQALTSLSKEGLVTLHPNRGAYVTRPTRQEALDLMETRRLIEPEIIRQVIARATPNDIEKLKAHLKEEDRAREEGNRRLIISLTGKFHMLLAELGGNIFIQKLMSELCPLTCLIIALYDAPQMPACPEDEHARIVEAIINKDVEGAIHLMLHHLNHIQDALHLGDPETRDIHWEALFG